MYTGRRAANRAPSLSTPKHNGKSGTAFGIGQFNKHKNMHLL